MNTITKTTVLIVLFTLTTACGKQHVTKPVTASTHSIWEIIEQTEAMAPKGLKGEFVLTIKNSGRQNSRIYLNTQEDYRDRRNITVTLNPSFQKQFKDQFNMDIRNYYEDQTILVKGVAKRVKIWVTASGRKPTKYYFQTHIEVNDLSQISTL